ncbi:hypothetical protein BKA67DRAFT_590788 [Truncatella angustata]|uniref:Uncharacterized protein n=1 Tax=Truncatella angustata TaxID=152316 RepID=A0A9P8UQF5_9PEZI|nr:uncharacterized protein BKA67DRAFT_590788 [Truncatella angustata]KAH6657085.1 hypothetical protein BKA67DRAFT_590788 [Truncatella angustata]
MPYDRSPNPTAGRPQVPMLSAGAARAVNKPTLAPKIAIKPSQGPTLAANAHTPLPKRTLRPGTGNVATPAPSRSTPQPEEDPLAFLSNNITPRSGKRQGRVESANSTPSGTPTQDAWERDARGGISPAPHNPDATRRPVASFTSNPSMPGKHEVRADLDSKFFHASEVKSTQPPPQKHTLAKAPSFFYANGNKPEKKPNTPSITSAPSHDNLSSKFVYANGTPDLKPSPPLGTSRPSSVVSMASRAPSSRPTSTHNGLGSAQRPASPARIAQPPHVAQSKHASRPQLTSTPSLGPPLGLRRTSTGTSISRGAHSRNSSGSRLSMGEAEMKHALVPPGPTSPLASPSLASPMHAPLSLASIIQAAEEFGDDESIPSPDGSRSDARSLHEVQSPARSTHSGDPLGDLVANARRERKVQDLQITNASLEAINRTLERQLRKQTAELRRFRRMSRAGGLPAIPSVASSRVVSDAHSAHSAQTGIEGLSFSDLEEEDSDDEPPDEEDESFSDTDSANESLSPTIIAERDARRMKRDEKRLQLDLSKHQELLVDSQKINQSIKRCMDWTEELIKEGKKALEYSVRVSDVEIHRPRVLNPVDEDDEPTQASINFDADATLDDISVLIDEGHGNSERIMPLEPKLAGWKPESQTCETDAQLPVQDG